jgi:hypothetical protein
VKPDSERNSNWNRVPISRSDCLLGSFNGGELTQPAFPEPANGRSRYENSILHMIFQPPATTEFSYFLIQLWPIW